MDDERTTAGLVGSEVNFMMRLFFFGCRCAVGVAEATAVTVGVPLGSSPISLSLHPTIPRANS